MLMPHFLGYLQAVVQTLMNINVVVVSMLQHWLALSMQMLVSHLVVSTFGGCWGIKVPQSSPDCIASHAAGDHHEPPWPDW